MSHLIFLKYKLVHTPLITAADCEGAGEQFTVTTMLPESGKVSDIATTKGGQIDYAKVIHFNYFS